MLDNLIKITEPTQARTEIQSGSESCVPSSALCDIPPYILNSLKL